MLIEITAVVYRNEIAASAPLFYVHYTGPLPKGKALREWWREVLRKTCVEHAVHVVDPHGLADTISICARAPEPWHYTYDFNSTDETDKEDEATATVEEEEFKLTQHAKPWMK